MTRKEAIGYHGTTDEQLPSIRQHGLRKGTFCSPSQVIAFQFAQKRSLWNGRHPIVLVVKGKFTKVRLDRKGRPEFRLRSWADVMEGKKERGIL